ncbi:MAG: prepilin-type N-terminal cleavage/methylation domain-containing protein [Opitutaceae bacterium]|nr:prepilin-type N-terminal cleavage/methylation domain-containing protein [Opitutaceae bacterium]
MNPLLRSRTRRRRRRAQGFTLIEIMIVVVIIGFLASMAIPAFQKVRRNTQNNTFVNDLRQMRAAAEECNMEHGEYPPDGFPGNFPAALEAYLPTGIGSHRTPVGGMWDWDYDQFGVKAGISVYEPTADAGQMQEVDRLVDDGNLGSGNFRARPSGYIYVIEF